MSFEVFVSWVEHRPEWDHLGPVLQTPKGRTAYDAVAGRPPKEAPISAGLRIVKNGKVLLVHPTNAPWKASYSIPKGLAEPGEQPIDVALREVDEEIGFDFSSVFDGRPIPEPENVENRDASGKLLKTVLYWTVDGSRLPDVIPRDQLQLEEVDWAGFVDPTEAEKRISPYQRPVLRLPAAVLPPEEQAERALGKRELDMALRGPLAVDLPGFKRGEMTLPRSREVPDPKAATRKLLEDRFGASALVPYVAEYKELMAADPQWLAKQRRRMEESPHQAFTDDEWAERVAHFQSEQEAMAYPFIAALVRKDPPSIIAALSKSNPNWLSVTRRWFGEHTDSILAEAKRAEQAFQAGEEERRAKAAEVDKAKRAVETLRNYRFPVEGRELNGEEFVAYLRTQPVALVKHTSPKVDYFLYISGVGLWELDKTFGAALRAAAPDLTDSAARTKTNTRRVERPTGLATTMGIHSWPVRYQWFDNKLDAHWATDGTGRVFMLGGLDAAERRRIERSGVNLATDAIKIVEIESAPVTRTRAEEPPA